MSPGRYPTRMCASVMLAALMLVCGEVHAQTPSSCKTFGFTAYTLTTTYDSGTNRTTYNFEIHNLSPLLGTYVNIGEVFVFGLPSPVSTSSPSGWVFKSIGPKTFWDTTSNPWWKTPPAIKPMADLTGFTYVISGPPAAITAIVCHVQPVTDASGQTSAGSTWFDCSVAGGRSCIAVAKSANPTAACVGRTVTYTLQVSNCGMVDLQHVTVNDSLLGDVTAAFIAANAGSSTLNVGATVTFTQTRAVQASDPDRIVNTVTACGTPPQGTQVCASAGSTVTAGRPCIHVAKSAEPTVVNVGDTITYTYQVANCGNVPLTEVEVDDTVLGDLTSSFVAANGSSDTLAMGSTVTFTATRMVQPTDPNPLCNTVTVAGHCCTCTVTDDDTACVDPVDPGVSSISGGAFNNLHCTGTLDPDDPPLTATFRLTYANGTYPVLDANSNPVADQTGTTYNFVHLIPGTYRVVETNPTGFVSTNAIPGTCAGSLKITNDIIEVAALADTDESVVCEHNNFLDCENKPCITVTKMVEPEAAPIGTTVTYTYLVENCGNVDLRNITVVDTLLGDLTANFVAAHGSDNLAYGDSEQFSTTRTVTSGTPNPLPNTVTVTGKDPFGNTVTDTDDGLTTIPATISGQAFQDFDCSGILEPVHALLENATFALTDVNGNPVLDIYGNVVTPQTGSSYSFKNLPPGVYLVTLTMPPDFIPTNAIPGLNAVKISDTQIAVYALEHTHYRNNDFLVCKPGCCISTDLTATPQIVSPGQTVSIGVKVCNCGNEAISNVRLVSAALGDLTDEFIAANGGSDTLEVVECVSFTVPYQVPPVLRSATGLQKPATIRVQVHGECSSGSDIDGSGDVTIGVLIPPDPRKQCFLPVTLTRNGWRAFCDPDNPIIKGGLVYSKFPMAFSCFTFNSVPKPNQLVIGGRNTITYSGKTSSLDRLCLLMSQAEAPCGRLMRSLDSPWQLPTQDGGALAVETIVLLMNVAYNDMRLMPRTPGYDLECFIVNSGPFRGHTVADVFTAANAILSGEPPCKYGVNTCSDVVDVLQKINANYEFVDFLTFNDRGYLTPNRALGPSDPPHCPEVPMVCSQR
jgi:uncharacterized repeat protein (TIGR01451 family)